MNYMSLNIKDAISQYPKLGELLTAYGIDCINCEIGTCKLSDILSIHNFPLETEELIDSQVKAVLENKPVDIASIAKTKIKHAEKIVFSQPLSELIQEHENISRMLNLAEYFIAKQGFLELYEEKLNSIIFYIKNYADKLHHAKEEDILFKMLSNKHEIINVIEQEHTIARALVCDIDKSILSKDSKQTKLLFTDYISLLRKHIKKENDILFVWFQNILTDEQMRQLALLFANKADSDIGISKNFLTFLHENYV